ncbi:MAG: alanine racemase [Papillibacter sp.]|nr:alanine racemase [Papillibacter sp.]
MDNLVKRTWAEISIKNIENNYRCLRSALPSGVGLMGVVKADSYGHGAVPVSLRLQELGCEYLAVTTIDEASELRENGITLPILILSPTPPECACELADLDLTQAVGDIAMARELSSRLNEASKKLKIHIKLETGMGRTGFTADDRSALDEVLELLNLPCLEAEGIFSHFAVSEIADDSFNEEQFSRFGAAVDFLRKESGHSFKYKHCSNSGAVINFKKYSLNMVRPGLALYGMYPGSNMEDIGLLPAMELKTRVAAITKHKKGDTISYGRTYTVPHDMKFAVLPIGYADGLHRILSNNMSVLINGKRAPQIGRICMDMCMADVSGIPDCKVGDVATVFGIDPSADELAEKAGTINYEIVCSVSKRVPRVYVY